MLSFWEKKHFLHYDYIIVGAGITGLSTACCIKERNASAKVLVIERGIFPTGASTKNAGFACIGSYTEKLADKKLMGEDAFLRLIEERWRGLYLLRKRLGDDNIDYQNNGGYELILSDHQVDPDELNEMNKMLAPVFKEKVFHLMPGLVHQKGLNKEMVKNMVVNPFEGQIDTGRMMKTLAHYAGLLQVRIVTGAMVSGIEESQGDVTVSVADPLNRERVDFKTQKVAVCTNAFTNQFFPELDIEPGRGHVLCTSPIKDLSLKGIYSFDEGYYYFRNFENRVIFGGGRNLDFEVEKTDDFSVNESIFNQLEFFLEEMILPGKQYTIEDKWTGIMAFGKDKQPIVKKYSDRIVVGARFNGMGIALGSKVAEDISTLLLE